jgi:hypothetical protein
MPTRRFSNASAALINADIGAKKVGEVVGHGQRPVAEILKLAGLLRPFRP